MTLNAGFELTGGSKWTQTGVLSSPTDQITIGSGAFSEIKLSLAEGTGADQAQKHWAGTVVVGAGLNVDLDLTALVGGPFGNVSFARVLVAIADIDAPDGAKLLRVGPQAVTNAWPAWFGGVAASNYEELRQTLFRVNTKAATPGWPVSGTTKMLRFNNPGGSSVTGRVFLVGV